MVVLNLSLVNQLLGMLLMRQTFVFTYEGWKLNQLNLADAMWNIGIASDPDSKKPPILDATLWKSPFSSVAASTLSSSAIVGKATIRTDIPSSANTLRAIVLEYLHSEGGTSDSVGIKVPATDLSGSEDKKLVIDFIIKIR